MVNKAEAIYLINDYIASDTTLKSYFPASTVQIYPLIADEPPAGGVSYPYIRYRIVPGVGPIFRLRTDYVQYIIGEKSFINSGKIIQRLAELLDMDDAATPTFITPIADSKYKIQSVILTGGTVPTDPDQENGVFERGLNFQIIYSVIS